MAEKPSPLFLIVLVAVTAIGPLSMQIFLPALPAIQTDYGVAPGTAQLSVSLSMIAIALATLAYGPLSDQFGRRPVLIAGMIFFLIGSVVCAMAPSIWLLIAGRIVQAAGGTCGMVLARAIVRDVYAEEKVASVLAYLTVAMVVAPMVAPAMGGVLTDTFGWRSNFTAGGLIGLAVLAAVLMRLAETRGAPPTHSGMRGLLDGGAILLRERRFNAFALQGAFSLSLFFTFASAAPYVMVNILNRPATEYGAYFILISLGFMAGNFVAGRLGLRISNDHMVIAGSTVSLSATVVIAALIFSGIWTPWAIFGPTIAVAFGSGLAMPNSQAAVLGVRPHSAGTASGLSGFAQMAMAAMFSQAVGLLQGETPYPMASLMLAAALASFAAAMVAARTHRAVEG